jgi:hypothetical protein
LDHRTTLRLLASLFGTIFYPPRPND